MKKYSAKLMILLGVLLSIGIVGCKSITVNASSSSSALTEVDVRVEAGYTGLWFDAATGWWYMENGAINYGYNGFALYDGKWWCVAGGRVALEYTGLWFDPQLGWWYVEGGAINLGYSGLVPYGDAWWCVAGGAVAFDYTGLWYDPVVGWWYVQNGTIDFGRSGLVLYNDIWWCVAGGRVAFDYAGLWFDPAVGWWYVQNGAINFWYNGLVPFGDAWWCVNGGRLDFGYTGLWWDANVGWWYVRNGAIDFSYTGMVSNESGWWYVQNGAIDFGYTGMASNENGWWYFSQGTVNEYFNGIGVNETGKWYFHNGRIDYSYSGLFKDDVLGWVNVVNGKVEESSGSGVPVLTKNTWKEDGVEKTGYWAFVNGEKVENYTGTVKDEQGFLYSAGQWTYMKNGDVDKEFTGLALCNDTWTYFKDGQSDYNFTGIARNALPQEKKEGYTQVIGSLAWYVKDGVVDKSYTGTFQDGSVTYNVTDGIASAQIPESNDPVMLGVFFDSRGNTTDSLYVSFDGYDFHRIGAAYTNQIVQPDEVQDASGNWVQLPGEQENNFAGKLENYTEPGWTQSFSWEYNTLHDPSIFYKDGWFWVVGGHTDGYTFTPMFGYSKDLINWSFPSAGKNQKGVAPSVTPNLRADGKFDAVAPDVMVDDDGTIWLTVSLGVYADSHDNKLSQYVMKITDLSVPSGATEADMATDHGKFHYSDFSVTYGTLDPVVLPFQEDSVDKDNPDITFNYDYDASLFKDNGRYYLVVQHAGEDMKLWSIADLNQASDSGAWKLENASIIEGSEGPYISKFNGKYMHYSDRYAGWEFFDGWKDECGIFVTTDTSLTGNFAETQRVNFFDKDGSLKPARHGTVITLTDPDAIARAKYALYKYTNE